MDDYTFLSAEQLGAFAAGVKQMLEDVQERLVYRTHIYIQTDITGYKPAPGDLAYPDKLVMMEVGAPSLISPSVPHTFWMFCTSEDRIFLFNSHSRCKIKINLAIKS